MKAIIFSISAFLVIAITGLGAAFAASSPTPTAISGESAAAQVVVDHDAADNSFYFFIAVAYAAVMGVLVFLRSSLTDAQGQTRRGLTVGARILGGNAIQLSLLVGMVIYIAVFLSTMGHHLDQITEIDIKATEMVMVLETEQLEQTILLERAFRYGESNDPHAQEKYDEALAGFRHLTKEIEHNIDKDIDYLTKVHIVDESEGELVRSVIVRMENLRVQHRVFDEHAEEVFALIASGGDIDEIHHLEEKVEAEADVLDKELKDFLFDIEHRTADALESIRAEEKDALSNTLMLAAAIILIGIALAMYNANAITKPLDKVIDSARQISAGSLQGAPLNMRRNDEIGLLGQSFDSMQNQLQLLAQQAEKLAAGNFFTAEVSARVEAGSDLETAATAVVSEHQQLRGDLVDSFDKLCRSLSQLGVQAAAIADDRLDDPTLAVRFEGDLGEAFARMNERMQWISHQAGLIAAGDLYNDQLVAEGTGTIGVSLAQMVVGLRQMERDLKARGEEAEKRQHQVLEVAANVLTSSDGVAASAEELSRTADGMAKGSEDQKDTIESTAAAIEQMSVSAQGVSANTEQLAQLMTENSAALNELAASISAVTQNSDQMSNTVVANSSAIEELAASIQTQADGAAQANQTASEASQAAQEGADVVRQAIQAIERIAERVRSSSSTIQELGKSSAQISTIVAVINDIADQTNLLALNAAIEAARAGEQGKGFMVVADEVRKLAERTSQATQEIDQMIGKIQTDTQEVVESMEVGMGEVEQGTELAAKSGEALGQIGEGVERVNSLMSQLTEASREQATTSDEIVRATAEMNELVQQVTGAMGEQAQAVEVVSQGSEEMQTQVDQVATAIREQTQAATDIARSMEQVNQVATDSQMASREMSQATGDLAQQAEELKGLANSFEEDEPAVEGNGVAALAN